MLHNFFAREDGQSLVEYALVLVLIAMAAIGILVILGANVGSVFERVANSLPGG